MSADAMEAVMAALGEGTTIEELEDGWLVTDPACRSAVLEPEDAKGPPEAVVEAVLRALDGEV